MNDAHFDTFAQALAAGASRRHLLGRALIGLTLTAATMHLQPHGGTAGKPGKGKKKKKVAICRAGQTLTVAKKALRTQLRQGAVLGACENAFVPPSVPPPVCTPDCTGQGCGDDGCGGTCGQCGTSQVCANGACCTPNCDGRNCDDDGCGGSCGSCQADEICTNGRCELTCPSGQVPCLNVCIPASCQSECNTQCRVIGASCCGPLTCQSPQAGQLLCRPAG